MSQLKFGRNYKLVVQKNDGKYLTLGLPYTIEFSLSRALLGSINSCQIRIYNLSETHRKELRFDFSNYSHRRIVQLNAGYGTNLPIVFYGTMYQAWSYREGVDFITTIECQDGAFAAANSIIPSTANFPAGTPWQTIYTTLMGYVKNTTFGYIGDSFIYNNDGSLAVTARSNSYVGDAITTLIEISGHAFFIDNGKTYILNNKEYIKTLGQIPIINTASGLLNTPLIEIKIVTLEMIFEPSLFVGQLIKLESQTTPYINSATIRSQTNNNYKITSLKHKATISPAVCGDAVTTVEFFAINSPI